MIRAQHWAAERPYDLATLILLALVALVVGAFAPGCAPGRAAPVDPDRARAALRMVLDRWKEGGRPEALKGQSPSIVVQDLDWEAGMKLVEYQILDGGRYDDANLRIPAALTLREPAGKAKEIRKKVKYVVGTSPTITVFREIF